LNQKLRQKQIHQDRNVSKRSKNKQETEDTDKSMCSLNTLTRLQGLTIPKLRQLLQVYKVLHRSKLHKKAEMIRVLLPLVRKSTPDSEDQKVSSKEVVTYSKDTRVQAPEITSHAGSPTNMIHGPIAQRFDDPVMGVDVHRDTLAFSIVDIRSVIVAGERENSDDGVNELLHLCKKHGVVMVGMESTSEYWLPVHWAMQSAGISTLVANPQQTKATQGVKTDPLDAQRIAFALRDGRLKPSVLCSPEAYALRKDLREMVHQIDAATAVQNRLRQIFHKARAGKELPAYLHTMRGSQILTGVVESRTQAEVYAVVKDAYAHHKGKTDEPQKLQPIARMVWNFLERLDSLHDRSRFYELLDEFYAHRAREHELLTSAIIYAKNHPQYKKNLQLLLSIPSIGLQTAVIILAEIVDITLFPTVKKLTKWTGLVPRTNKSGFKKRGSGKIYKGGNHYLRRAVWLAAQSEYRFGELPSHPVGQLIRRLYVQKQRTYKKAVTAGAHKLLRIVYGVLSTQTEFHLQSDPADQVHLIRMTQRKLNELDRTCATTPTVDAVPLLLERLTQTMTRMTAARQKLEMLYTEVYQKKLPVGELEFEKDIYA
jgi:transposase